MKYILLTLILLISTSLYSDNTQNQPETKKLAWGYGHRGFGWGPGAGFRFGLGRQLGGLLGSFGLPFWGAPYYRGGPWYAPYY